MSTEKDHGESKQVPEIESSGDHRSGGQRMDVSGKRTISPCCFGRNKTTEQEVEILDDVRNESTQLPKTESPGDDGGGEQVVEVPDGVRKESTQLPKTESPGDNGGGEQVVDVPEETATSTGCFGRKRRKSPAGRPMRNREKYPRKNFQTLVVFKEIHCMLSDWRDKIQDSLKFCAVVLVLLASTFVGFLNPPGGITEEGVVRNVNKNATTVTSFLIADSLSFFLAIGALLLCLASSLPGTSHFDPTSINVPLPMSSLPGASHLSRSNFNVPQRTLDSRRKLIRQLSLSLKVLSSTLYLVNILFTSSLCSCVVALTFAGYAMTSQRMHHRRFVFVCVSITCQVLLVLHYSRFTYVEAPDPDLPDRAINSILESVEKNDLPEAVTTEPITNFRYLLVAGGLTFSQFFFLDFVIVRLVRQFLSINVSLGKEMLDRNYEIIRKVFRKPISEETFPGSAVKHLRFRYERLGSRTWNRRGNSFTNSLRSPRSPQARK